MYLSTAPVFLLATAGFAAASTLPRSPGKYNDLLVKTDLFTVQGMVSPNSSTVRIFKGIPYAEPPVGDARFRPPLTKKASSTVIDGTNYASYCIGYNPGGKNVYSEYLRGALNYPDIGESEDCLHLNIWTARACRRYSRDDQNLSAVMLWIHGGGYTAGGAAEPIKEGSSIVKNHQDVIIVSIDYRMNIFGFPNAAGLDGHNLNPGMMDIRKAVEWVYDNIWAFGGDRTRIILFGQSAGGNAVDSYAYAYASDPLVYGLIPESGTALIRATSPDPLGSNFTYAASHFNCTGSKEEEFQCMQKVNATALINVYNKYNASANGGRTLTFVPQIDGETFFANYSDLTVRGQYAKVPLLVGNADNEGATLAPYNPNGPANAAIVALYNKAYSCGTAATAFSRRATGTSVWRYRYFGNYPNVNPLPWLGAYHSSEIPMIWGTTTLTGPDTPSEAKMSAYMQSAWIEFAKDPANALTKNFQWPQYDPNGNSLIELGVGNSTSAVFVKGSAFDSQCSFTQNL